MPMYEKQDQLYNWWDPVKSEDAGLLVQNLLRTFWLLSMKPRMGAVPIKPALIKRNTASLG